VIHSRGERVLVKAETIREAIYRYCKQLAKTGRLKVKGIERKIKVTDLNVGLDYKVTLKLNIEIEKYEKI